MEAKKGKNKNKNRRPKRKKMLRDIRIYYDNVRGLKSKTDSLEIIFEELQPSIICLVETHLEEGDNVYFEDYEVIIRNDSSNASGGILIAVKEDLQMQIVEVVSERWNEVMSWCIIHIGSEKIRLGVVYFPQENSTKVNELKLLYKVIEEQIQVSSKENSHLLLLGDFNCKIGNSIIKKNTPTISKGGRLLIKMVNKYSLTVENGSDKCEGLWTRVERTKSVIDYVISSSDCVSRMQIDENREFTPFSNHSNTCKHTDHNAIILDLHIQNLKQPKVKIMTSNSYKKYAKELADKGILDSFNSTTGDKLQEEYNKWMQIVEKAIRVCTRKISRKKFVSKRVAVLIKERKALQRELKRETCQERKKLILLYMRIRREKMAEIRKDGRRRKVAHIVSNLRAKNTTIWDINKKMKRREKSQHEVVSACGQRISDPSEIIQEYARYYEDLLKTKPANTEEERKVERHVNKRFTDMIENASKEPYQPIKEEDVNKALRQLKMKKAPDKWGWKAEWLKHGGEVMTRSLVKLFNAVDQNKYIPLQWKEITVVSINKGKGKKTKLNESQRGIFLTNVVSKVYEKVKKIRYDETLDQNMHCMQTAGRKNRSAIDNILIAATIIGNNKAEEKSTYAFFADAEKAFDRLWLKDALLDLHDLGVSNYDAQMLYNLNKEAIINVKTPFGLTDPITVKEVVKQGTIFGPVLCCAATSKVNTVGSEVKVKIGNTEIGMPVHMDDIATFGNIDAVKLGISNCKVMERRKKVTYGSAKTKYMIINKELNNEGEVFEQLERGIVKREVDYKYMGIKVNESGNLQDHLNSMENKTKSAISQVFSLGSPYQVGEEFVRCRIELFTKCIMLVLTYGIYAWNISQKEINFLATFQAKYLKKILEIPVSTPTDGILMETGVWPLKERLQYLSMMYFHNLVNSKNRIASLIVAFGKKDSLIDRVKETCEVLQINIESVSSMSKSKWKKLVKEKLQAKINDSLRIRISDKTKCRFLRNDKWELKKYFTHMNGSEALKILCIRLNMWDLSSNYRKDNMVCIICKRGLDSTEHVLSNHSMVNPVELHNHESKEWTNIVNAFVKYDKIKKEIIKI